MVKKSKDFFSEEFFWKEVMPQLTKALFGGDLAVMLAWIAMSKTDKRIESLNNLIAVSEVVPNIDLNLPRGVVLGAMYDKQDEALQTMIKIMEMLEEVPDIITEQLEELKDTIVEEIVPEEIEIPEIPEDGWPPRWGEEPTNTEKVRQALKDCIANAHKNLGAWYYVGGAVWVHTCLARKGFKVSLDFVKENAVFI